MNFEHIGWMVEGKSDKVWGMILLQKSERYWHPCKYISFWGRRGAKLLFLFVCIYVLNTVI
jgi:hypothetical protein